MSVYRDFEVWLNLNIRCCCAVGKNLLYCIAICRESIVFFYEPIWLKLISRRTADPVALKQIIVYTDVQYYVSSPLVALIVIIFLADVFYSKRGMFISNTES